MCFMKYSKWSGNLLSLTSEEILVKGHLTNNGNVDGFIHLAKEQLLPVKIQYS